MFVFNIEISMKIKSGKNYFKLYWTSHLWQFFIIIIKMTKTISWFDN